MIDQNSDAITHQSLLAAAPDERVELVVAYLLGSARRLRPEVAETFDAETVLSDLGIDSLQIVELKFGLDELIGSEVDVEVIIANPTIRQLAEESVRRSGI